MALTAGDQPGPHQLVVATIPGLRTSALYSDLTLQLGDRKWSLHKLVVCPKSKFFANACNGDWQEAQNGLIEIHEDDPDAVHAMVEYLYTGAYYQAKPSNFDADLSSLNVNVFTVADKYEVIGLAGLASDNFKESVSIEWKSPKFAEVIRELYENSPDNNLGKEMRKHVVHLCTESEGSDSIDDPMNIAPTSDIRMAVRDVILFGSEFQKVALRKETALQEQKIQAATALQEQKMRAATALQKMELEEERAFHDLKMRSALELHRKKLAKESKLHEEKLRKENELHLEGMAKRIEAHEQKKAKIEQESSERILVCRICEKGLSTLAKTPQCAFKNCPFCAAKQPYPKKTFAGMIMGSMN